jgi:hypothetical protein
VVVAEERVASITPRMFSHHARNGEAVWLLDVSQLTLPNDLLVTGPTEESNWVLQGRMMVGAYPSAIEDYLNDEILASILELGCATFVCLQSVSCSLGVESCCLLGLKAVVY